MSGMDVALAGAVAGGMIYAACWWAGARAGYRYEQLDSYSMGREESTRRYSDSEKEKHASGLRYMRKYRGADRSAAVLWGMLWPVTGWWLAGKWLSRQAWARGAWRGVARRTSWATLTGVDVKLKAELEERSEGKRRGITPSA